MIKHGLRQSLKLFVPYHLMHVYEPSCIVGHVGLVGLDLFDVTEEHTTEANSVQLLPKTAS